MDHETIEHVRAPAGERTWSKLREQLQDGSLPAASRSGGCRFPSREATRSGRWASRRCGTGWCRRRCGTCWNRSSSGTLPSTATGSGPERGCKDALRRVDELLKAGYRYVVDADLKSYFDTIPHERLMERVRGAGGGRAGAGTGRGVPEAGSDGRAEGVDAGGGNAARGGDQSAAGEHLSRPAGPSDGASRVSRWCAMRTTS